MVVVRPQCPELALRSERSACWCTRPTSHCAALGKRSTFSGPQLPASPLEQESRHDGVVMSLQGADPQGTILLLCFHLPGCPRPL